MHDAKLDVAVADLRLPNRAAICLREAKVLWLSELVTWTPSRLLKLPRFGQKSLFDVSAALSTRGLSLKAE
jgi:DNA-directed RNA polymerase alpha subunit